jgi:hypothetical protein
MIKKREKKSDRYKVRVFVKVDYWRYENFKVTIYRSNEIFFVNFSNFIFFVVIFFCYLLYNRKPH